MTVIINGTTGITYPDGQSQDVGVPDPGTSGNVLTSNGTVWTSASAPAQTRISGGTTGLTPSSLTGGDVTLAGTLAVANGGTGSTSTTYCNLASNVTGTLPVANGGTGQTTLTANNVLLGNGTSGVQVVAPGSSGNVLTSNGTTWTSSAPSGGVTSLNGQTGAITNTGFNAIGSYAIVLGYDPGGTQVYSGSTYSGSNLNVGVGIYMYGTYTSYNGYNKPLSGTWRCMGGCGARFIYEGGDYYTGGVLFVRVS